MNSIAITRLCTQGTCGKQAQVYLYCAKSRSARRALDASCRKSSSSGRFRFISSASHSKLNSGNTRFTQCTRMVTICMSTAENRSTSGCSILTASSCPVRRSRARCTWASEATPSGFGSRYEKASSNVCPVSLRNRVSSSSSGVG